MLSTPSSRYRAAAVAVPLVPTGAGVTIFALTSSNFEVVAAPPAAGGTL
jgi:hypothetical protein